MSNEYDFTMLQSEVNGIKTFLIKSGNAFDVVKVYKIEGVFFTK